MSIEDIGITAEKEKSVREKLVEWCKTHLTDKQFTLI